MCEKKTFDNYLHVSTIFYGGAIILASTAQKKFQGAATSVEDAVTIFRGLNLAGTYCSSISCGAPLKYFVYLELIVIIFSG
jgi:hypothetical protein